MDGRLCIVWNQIVQYRFNRIVNEMTSNQTLVQELKDIREVVAVKTKNKEYKQPNKDIYAHIRKAIDNIRETELKDERVKIVVQCAEDLLAELHTLNSSFTTYLNETQRLYSFYFQELRSAFTQQFTATADVYKTIRAQFQSTQKSLQEWKSNQAMAVTTEEQKVKSELRDWCSGFAAYLTAVLEIMGFFLDPAYRSDIRFDYDRVRKSAHNKYDPKVPKRLRSIESPPKMKPQQLYQFVSVRLQKLKTMPADFSELFKLITETLMAIDDQISGRVLQPTRMFVHKNERRVAKELEAVQMKITQQKQVVEQLQAVEQQQLHKLGTLVTEREMEHHRILQDDITRALAKLNSLMVDQHDIQKLQAQMKQTIHSVNTQCPSLDTFETILGNIQRIDIQKSNIEHKHNEKSQTAEDDFQRQCHTLLHNALQGITSECAQLHAKRQSIEQELWNDYYATWLQSHERLLLLEKHMIQRRNIDFKGNIDFLLLQLDGVVELTRQYQDHKKNELQLHNMGRFIFVAKKTMTE